MTEMYLVPGYVLVLGWALSFAVGLFFGRRR
jgi:hypothetical protein